MTVDHKNPIDARHPLLEAAVFDRPEDPESYRVLADWLQQRGDPRGELIVLQLAEEAGADPRAASDLMARYAAYFVGPLARYAEVQDGTGTPTFRWARGFILSARFSQLRFTPMIGTVANALAELLPHPSGRFLRELSIGFNNPDRDLQAPIDAIVQHPPRALQVLHLGDTGPVHARMARELGDLSRLWHVLPRLETLRLVGRGATFGELFTAALPTLRVLSLEGFAEGDALCDRLLEAPLLPGLRTLDLRRSNISDSGAARLLGARERLAHLERLDLSQNLIGSETCAALVAALPRAAVDDQQVAADELERELLDY